MVGRVGNIYNKDEQQRAKSEIPLTLKPAFMWGRVRANSKLKSRNSAKPAGVANLPTVYNFIS
jgi:hypothetical protein